MFILKELPHSEQNPMLFWFYVINLFIALLIELTWGFITPSISSEQGIWTAFGFLFISFVEVGFALLAFRHVDAAEEQLEKKT